jgi:tRNA(Arg) A34 adenosine deaminase TadA
MSLQDLDHEHFMRLAIAEARKVPDLPFGAVIVDGPSGQVVAAGHNRSLECPTFHGEIDAIQRCAAEHPGIDWMHLALYTTAESCPMCQAAILWAGIGLTVFGTSIPYLKEVGWWQIDIRAEEVIRRTPFRHCALLGGVLEEECNALFRTPPGGLYREKD